MDNDKYGSKFINKPKNSAFMEDLSNGKISAWRWQKILMLVFITVVVLFVVGITVATQLSFFEPPHVLLKKLKTTAADCKSCYPLTMRGGQNHLKFEISQDKKGCKLLKVTCGQELGTEAIIQWYKDDQDLGVSFMDRVGQSNIQRTLNCNNNGEYELDENGEVEAINGIECIVATDHEEL
uniref:Ig-like domain-containing protein n=1 Tax=Ditylenchus dipsaci TaxID=166011 RepID=A0A915CR03_9BILA